MNTLLLTALARAAQEFSNTITGGLEGKRALESLEKEASVLPSMEQSPQTPAPGPVQPPPASTPEPVQPIQPVQPVQPAQVAPSAQVVQMPQQPPPAAQASAEATSDLTLQQVQEIVGGYVQRMDDGKQAQLLQLIQSFGVNRVSALDPAHYGAFLQKAEEVANG